MKVEEVGRHAADLANKCQAAANDGGRPEDPKGEWHANGACGVCKATRGARWTSPNSCDLCVANSSSSKRHACDVCGGNLEVGLIFAVVPQAPPLANLGRGSQEHGKVDDDVEDLIYSNECGIPEDFSKGERDWRRCEVENLQG